MRLCHLSSFHGREQQISQEVSFIGKGDLDVAGTATAVPLAATTGVGALDGIGVGGTTTSLAHDPEALMTISFIQQYS